MKKQTEADKQAEDNSAADACADAAPALIEIYIDASDHDALYDLRAKIEQMNLPPSIHITTCYAERPRFVVEYVSQKPATDALEMLSKYDQMSNNPLMKGFLKMIF